MNNYLQMILSAFILMGGACSNFSLERQAAKPESPFQSKCFQIVENYVVKTRGWRREDYEIISKQAELGGQGFSVVYLPSEELSSPGEEDKSFHLELDKACEKPIAELGYQ